MEKTKTHTLIIGAGLIGSATAWQLARMGAKDIRVVDLDLEGTLSSSELNAGGVRATFSQPINIECSKSSIDYFSSVADDVGYKACGYLWLKRPDQIAEALRARDLHLKHGWNVEAWDVAQVKARLPFIDKTDDLAGATFGVRDGLINPNLLKNHFRARARELGVVFEDRVRVYGAEYVALGEVNQKIRVKAQRAQLPLDEDLKRGVLSGEAPAVTSGADANSAGRLSSTVNADGRTSGAAEYKVASGVAVWREVAYEADRVVNCAGAWAGELARILGYKSPAFAVRRQVSIFDCRDVDLTPYGMVIDPSGVYFHPEATSGLAGFCNKDEPTGVNYHYDGETFFMEQIWPALFERATGFERLRHLTGWAGQYEVSPDESAIIGLVRDGDAGRSAAVFESHSYSGHGAMHSYAAGVGLAELMTRGRYEALDLSVLSGDRFERGALMHEGMVI